MIENTCPNCMGKMDLSSNKKKLICPYCDSEFMLEDDEQDIYGDGEEIEKDWFIYDWDIDELLDIPKCDTVISMFIRCLNEYESSKDLEEYIRTYLMSCEDVCAIGIREQNMSTVRSRISSYIEPDEHIVLYYDDGILTHGKTGTVITDKRTLFVEKRNIINVEYNNMPYLLFDYSIGIPGIRLADQYENNIAPLGTEDELVGAMGALICFYAFENNPNRPKIRLTTE